MLETLLKAFCTWNTVSEKKAPVGPGPPEREPPLSDGADPGLSLSDLVTISLGRHDLVRQDRETAHSRAYQLLSFNAASSMLLVGGVQFLWERLAGLMIWIVLAMLLIVLYLSMKAIVHCLRAVSTRYVGDLSPLTSEDARTVLAGSSGARKVALQVLGSLERLYETNDRARAISAEHSELALRTTMAYSCMLVLTLLAVAAGGFGCHRATAHLSNPLAIKEVQPMLFGWAIGLVIVAFVFLVVVYLPRYQVKSVKEKRFDALLAARRQLIEVIGGILLLLAGTLAAYSSLETLRLSFSAQITERFVEATRLVTEEKTKMSSRVAGLYALERIARESLQDHWPIFEFYSMYLREEVPVSTKEKAICEGVVLEDRRLCYPADDDLPSEDVSTVAAILGRRCWLSEERNKGVKLQLKALRLPRLQVPAGSNFERVNMGRTFLQCAILKGAQFQGGKLGADLRCASLRDSIESNGCEPRRGSPSRHRLKLH